MTRTLHGLFISVASATLMGCAQTIKEQPSAVEVRAEQASDVLVALGMETETGCPDRFPTLAVDNGFLNGSMRLNPKAGHREAIIILENNPQAFQRLEEKGRAQDPANAPLRRPASGLNTFKYEMSLHLLSVSPDLASRGGNGPVTNWTVVESSVLVDGKDTSGVGGAPAVFMEVAYAMLAPDWRAKAIASCANRTDAVVNPFSTEGYRQNGQPSPKSSPGKKRELRDAVSWSVRIPVASPSG